MDGWVDKMRFIRWVKNGWYCSRIHMAL